MKSALGGNEKQLSRTLTNALGKKVTVNYDDSSVGYASMKTGADGNVLTVNPELILRTENALREEAQEAGETYTGNVARQKLMHEIGHAAARMDSSFIPKVLDEYRLLREHGLLTNADVNEEQIRRDYAEQLQKHMETEPAKAEARRLMEKGMEKEDAVKAAEDAYLGEEYAMQTLEFVERVTNGGFSAEILGERRNILVQAIQRIRDLFRSIAARLKGTDDVNSAKAAGFADKLERFVHEFVEEGIKEQESAGDTQSGDNAKADVDTGESGNEESGRSTGTQDEDVRYSLGYRSAEVNKSILSMIQRVKVGDFKDNETVDLGVVPDEVASSIEEITGIDVHGFHSVIEARQIRHIIKDHGENGLTDHSMKNDEDIAKIEYALDTPDDIRESGTTKAYTQRVDNRDRMAGTVLYEKYIGSESYYVVQAVTDSKKKTLYIVSAFIGRSGYKKGTSAQPANAQSPDVTSENATVEVPVNSIAQSVADVNGENEDVRYSVSEIHDTVEEAIRNKGEISEKYNQKKISRVPERLVRMVLEASGGKIDISSKYVALSGSEIYHEYKRHSDGSLEASRDQIALTQDEITEAVAAIYEPDVVESLFTTKDNPTQRQSFAYAKKAKGYYVVAEAVGGNRNPNIVPVLIIQVSDSKWNRYMDAGMTIGEMLNENNPEMLAALDVSENKKNRVIAAQFVSDETIANTPHSPQFKDSIAQNGADVNGENEDIRFSLITSETSDRERARILRGKAIADLPTARELSGDAAQAGGISVWEDIDSRFGKEKRALIQKLAREFGVFKEYENADIDLSFEFTENNLRESYGKQKRRFRQFAKMLSVFDGVVDKAVGIEVHLRDDYKPDPTLQNVYVLMSAFVDGDEIVPVKLEVKEFRDKENKLYVAVSLEGIKMTEVSEQGNTEHGVTQGSRSVNTIISDPEDSVKQSSSKKETEVSKQGNTEHGVTQNSRSVTISIPDLMRNVKASDTNFTKYFPQGILTEAQKAELDKRGDVRYSLPDVKKITPSEEQISDNIRDVAEMNTVYTVGEGDLAVSGKSLKEIYSEYFSSWGENIHSEMFGDIAVKNSSIRSEIRHGSTAEKIASIGAIPSVIENGRIVDWIEKHPGVYRVVVAAPIRIGNTPYFMGVMLQRDAQNQRLYLHDVEIEKETSASEQDDLLTTGSHSESESLFITSILQKIIDVKMSKNKSAGNVNGESRYSLTKEQEAQAYIARMEEDKAFLKKLLQDGRRRAMSPAAVDAMERELREGWGVTKADSGLVRGMFGVADAMYNGKMEYDAGMARLTATARDVLENVYEVDDTLLRENEAFVKYVKSLSLSVPSDNESDLPGGYGEYRREHAKYVKLSRNGTSVDTVYEEICGMFPGMLDREIANPADQIEEIVSVMRSLQPEDVPTYTDTLEEAAEMLAADILAKYDRGARETYSSIRDKQQQRALDRAATAYEARISRIEMNAARDAKEYGEIIEQYRGREEAREMADDRREFSRRIRQDARAIRSAAASPNRKRFIPEEYRKAAEHAAQWLDAVSRSGRGIPADVTSYVRGSMDKLAGLYGEDFAGLSRMLLDEMDSFVSGTSQSENEELRSAYAYRAAYKLGRLLRKSIADHNRVVLDGKLRDAAAAGGEIVSHLNSRRHAERAYNTLDVGKGGKIKGNNGAAVRGAYRKIALSTMDGYSFLRRMGSVGMQLYGTLREAQSAQVMRAKEYVDTLERELLYSKKNKADGVKLSDYIGDRQKMVTVTLSNGEKFTLTAAQAMNIVTLYERAAGRSHIENGGVRLMNPKDRTLTRAAALTAADVAAIRENLDAQDLRVMEVMNRFIRENCTNWGNTATLERYGFYRFTTQDYFPITVDRNALPANMTKEQALAAVQFNVENVGFAKSADAAAQAPVIMDSFIDVVNRHVEGMATYSAYLNAEDAVNRIMSAPGVRDAMQRALGRDSIQYMEEMMTALKGGGRTTTITDSLADWWLRNSGAYKSAAVSYNLSTAAKQPLSYIRAAAVMNPKYLVQGMHGASRGREAHEEMMRYSGIGVKKDMGYSEVGVSRSVGSQIGYEKGGVGKAIRDFNEFGMKGAAKMDEITWDSLWIACREEVMDKNPDISSAREAWMKATAKRFAEVVAQTQVVDSPLDSSPLSRSRIPFVRNVFAFYNEPLKGFNLMMNALDDLLNAKSKSEVFRAGGKLSRVLAVNAAGWGLETLVSAVFKAIRDDDDDPSVVGEKWKEYMWDNVKGAVPYVAQFIDLFEDIKSGFSYEDTAISVFSDIISSAFDLVNTLEDPEGEMETKIKQCRNFVESVAVFFGIPLGNINRIFVNLAKSFNHITDKYVWEYELQKMTCNPKSASARDKHEFNSLLADAYLSGDKESYEYIYNDMRSLGLNPQTVVAGISKDAYSADIADSQKTSLVRYTPGSDPWYIGMKTIFNRDKDAPRATEEEITRVYEATEDTAVLPKFKDGGYSVGGKDRKLEGEAYEAYLEEYGTTLYEIVNVMRDLPAYRRGTAEERAWWLTKAENFAHAVAVYHQDSEYSFSSKWFGEYKNSRPIDAAKYIVGNLAKK